jgi:FixJ family two-component response regulator
MTSANGTICVVDDDAQVRRFLVEVFTSVGLDVKAFESGDAFVQNWRPNGPTCVLLDIRMPGMSGLEVQDWLRARYARTPIIFLTGHADVPIAVGCMRNGAFDFLEKPFNIQHLIERTQNALNSCSERRRSHAEEDTAWLATLTPREHEVLNGIVAGDRNKEIANHLHISERTVETHRSKIMQKSGAHSAAELVAQVVANFPAR